MAAVLAYDAFDDFCNWAMPQMRQQGIVTNVFRNTAWLSFLGQKVKLGQQDASRMA